MHFTDTEIEYLRSQPLGRLATAKPDGTLQVSPVSFTVDSDTGTIDVKGFKMAASRKFRNVADNGKVAFVVDDLASVDPWRVRCIEIRGHAEAIEGPAELKNTSGIDHAVIRIHPRRIISFGIGQDEEAHDLTPNSRNVG